MLRESLSYTPIELAFGTSGLRGLVTDMTDLECYINTAGFLEFLKEVDGITEDSTIYLAGDLRDSTPRITRVMVAAINDAGMKVGYAGLVPTPAIAYYARLHDAPCIMVTGSHIPADRNGIKFYKTAGEILKADEGGIKSQVAKTRAEIYAQTTEDSLFTASGSHKNLPALPAINPQAAELYKKRYTDVFAADSLAGTKIVMYQHSAVGRDSIVEILEALGAKVTPIGRSDVFIPIDTENVTSKEDALFHTFAQQHPDAFAIVSTDGDSDRPFVIDETGKFHRGDVLGLVCAEFLGAPFAAVPISANDAVDVFCKEKGIELVHTRIGSPYVVVAMEGTDKKPAVGWEVNGGFLTGQDIATHTGTLSSLPTRDALLPILAALLTAKESSCKVSDVFANLPKRYTGSGLVDAVAEDKMATVRTLDKNPDRAQTLADAAFAGSSLGGSKLDTTDGLRLVFESGDVVHLRASGNAPQVRVYTNCDSQERADKLVADALARNGYIEKLLNQL